MKSFQGRFRDECLNRELLAACSMRLIAHAFRDEYNMILRTADWISDPGGICAELLRQAPGSGQARQAGPSVRPELASVPSHKPANNK